MVKRKQHIGMFLHNEMGVSWGGMSLMCGRSSIHPQKIFFLRSIEEHLNAADMHMISLNKEWNGLVVPSKLLGSLATGKPFIYAGPEDSSIACLLREHEIGFYIDEKSLEDVVTKLDYLSNNSSAMNLLQKNAFGIY